MNARPAIPKTVKEAVLKEFHHLCAICGEKAPQLHHIDEDNSNNDPLNLLPLCPNHHLTDQHNPTSKIEPEILTLFRKHKDPTILSPQFKPLFDRFYFLEWAIETGEDWTGFANERNERAHDLVAFVEKLEMGGYYGAKIEKHLRWAKYIDPEYPSITEERSTLARSAIYVLIMEMLRYQSWRREKEF